METEQKGGVMSSNGRPESDMDSLGWLIGSWYIAVLGTGSVWEWTASDNLRATQPALRGSATDKLTAITDALNTIDIICRA